MCIPQAPFIVIIMVIITDTFKLLLSVAGD